MLLQRRWFASGHVSPQWRTQVFADNRDLLQKQKGRSNGAPRFASLFPTSIRIILHEHGGEIYSLIKAGLNWPAKNGNSQDDMGEHIPQAAKSSPSNRIEANTDLRKAVEHASQGARTTDAENTGEVNMEAAITLEEVVRAGGFGARDDISSLLPVASDSTDFEESILDARDYEEPQGKISRPGLGWSEGTDQRLQP